MVKIKAVVTEEGDEQWICLCGNTFADKGFEQSVSDRHNFCAYTFICQHCGRKFDEGTFEVVGVRLGRAYRNELISREEFEQIGKQGQAYYGRLFKLVMEQDN